MKAGAVRDVNAMPSIVTPIANSISEAILPIMQYIGMRKITVKNEKAANLMRISSDVEFFEGTPESMMLFSKIIKDSLAEIVAASGIMEIEIEASKEELEQLKNSYDQLAAMYEAAKISATDSAEPAVPTSNLAADKKVQKKKCSCRGSKCKVKNQ